MIAIRERFNNNYSKVKIMAKIEHKPRKKIIIVEDSSILQETTLHYLDNLAYAGMRDFKYDLKTTYLAPTRAMTLNTTRKSKLALIITDKLYT